MHEDELRALVREVVQRHLGHAAPQGPVSSVLHHASHGRFQLSNGEAEGACLIEPAVRCNHCGFCQSYGH
jgi:hypothetical protein